MFWGVISRFIITISANDFKVSQEKDVIMTILDVLKDHLKVYIFIPKTAEDNSMLCYNYPRDWKRLYQFWHWSSGTPFCLQSLMWVVLGIMTAVLFCTWCRKCMITKGASSRTLTVVQNHDAHGRKTKTIHLLFFPCGLIGPAHYHSSQVSVASLVICCVYLVVISNKYHRTTRTVRQVVPVRGWKKKR